ncbi:splicing factor 1 [Anaeramoeba flamelloides]|uniref:Splicing factor 1 n=1 Tax=Anaeramoeba flamelloides TaxID=1746091 RepID=A0ABQ8YQM6_9EUKA|nr:splicing factor 1 [Anaeramoeba flamelloides]
MQTSGWKARKKLVQVPIFLPNNLEDSNLEAILLRIRLEEICSLLDEKNFPSSDILYPDLKGETGIKDGLLVSTKRERAIQKLREEKERLNKRCSQLSTLFKLPEEDIPEPQFIQKRVLISSMNLVGVLLGPKGSTIEKIKRETNTKIIIQGKGMVAKSKNPNKTTVTNTSNNNENDEIRQEPLHALIIGTEQEQVDQAEKIVRKITTAIPDEFNELKRNQLRELAMIKGGATVTGNSSYDVISLAGKRSETAKPITSSYDSRNQAQQELQNQKIELEKRKFELQQQMKFGDKKMESDYIHLMKQINQGIIQNQFDLSESSSLDANQNQIQNPNQDENENQNQIQSQNENVNQSQSQSQSQSEIHNQIQKQIQQQIQKNQLQKNMTNNQNFQNNSNSISQNQTSSSNSSSFLNNNLNDLMMKRRRFFNSKNNQTADNNSQISVNNTPNINSSSSSSSSNEKTIQNNSLNNHQYVTNNQNIWNQQQQQQNTHHHHHHHRRRHNHQQYHHNNRNRFQNQQQMNLQKQEQLYNQKPNQNQSDLQQQQIRKKIQQQLFQQQQQKQQQQQQQQSLYYQKPIHSNKQSESHFQQQQKFQKQLYTHQQNNQQTMFQQQQQQQQQKKQLHPSFNNLNPNLSNQFPNQNLLQNQNIDRNSIGRLGNNNKPNNQNLGIYGRIRSTLYLPEKPPGTDGALI